jgi:hypothetical protein
MVIEKMAQHHRHELYLRLERVDDIGASEIRKKELLLWYGADRLTPKVWIDIMEKWQEVNEGDDAPLLVGEADGVWLFVYGKGLVVDPKIKDDKDKWLVPISSKIKR